MQKEWCVYLLKCADNTYYCGCTSDLSKRLGDHNAGKGSRYTRTRLPVELISHSQGMTKPQAYQLEYWVKKQPRQKKLDYLQKNGTTPPKDKSLT